MEVREIIETSYREPLIEVKFRFNTDLDDVIRVCEFDVKEIEEFGYCVITEDFDIFDFDDDWDDDYEAEDEDNTIDEDELISFMNEYFLISGKVPPAEFF